MSIPKFAIFFALSSLGLLNSGLAYSANCKGNTARVHKQDVFFLKDQGVAIYTGMNINIDGSRRAYHEDNYAGGALLHFVTQADHIFLMEAHITPLAVMKLVVNFKRTIKKFEKQVGKTLLLA